MNMKTNFKPIGLAVAVAAASAGYAGIANAVASVDANNMGDLAIVPYYTTMGDFVTGVHVINTSAKTQVVKMRLRRATDSVDVLDFNLILSPQDEWTGYITRDGDEGTGTITFNTNDKSCTAPKNTGKFIMPKLYRRYADTGYIEVIAMGSPTSEVGGIAAAAKHGSTGVPADCTAVASNFLKGGVAAVAAVPAVPAVAAGATPGDPNGPAVPAVPAVAAVPAVPGNVDYMTTVQANPRGSAATNRYEDAGDVLKVSYFIRDGASGVEFGNNAVHIVDFMDSAAMTNQQTGISGGDLSGYDFPDLNGPAPAADPNGVIPARTNYAGLRAAIGGNKIINDWSANQREAGFTVGTDWVVTIPGQYVMVDRSTFLDSVPENAVVKCLGTNAATAAASSACDYRDIPLTATFSVWDREERGIVGPASELVVSPSLPGRPDVAMLKHEVNVIEWGVAPVLHAPSAISVSTPVGSAIKNGWARLSVTPWAGTTQAVCDFARFTPAVPDVSPQSVATTCSGAGSGVAVDGGQVPMVGFVAWERSFAANPDANYGRIVGHSYSD